MQSKIQNPKSKILLSLLLLLPQLSLTANGQTAGSLSQRRINEYAASLLTAERALLEAPRLRQPDEPLPAYLRRLTLPLPNESEPQRRTRINGYFAALAKAITETAGLRKVPTLCDADAANLKTWKTASAAIAALPRCLQSLRADFKREKTAPDALPTELTQTIFALHAAREALRDARP